MLWYKGWLETRFRLLFMLGFTVFNLFMIHKGAASGGQAHLRAAIAAFTSFSVPLAVVMFCAFLAGAGIVTQPSLQASKGLHGSTLFTLSMPVSRLRLLAVRASIGWLEVAALIGVLCCELWFGMPALRGIATPLEILEQAVTLIACSSTLYFVSVLLATLLDDQWRTWSTMLTAAGIWWLCTNTPLPAFADLFHAMGKGSPVLAHTMPLHAMAFSVGLSAVLFFAALQIAQRREY